MPQKRSISAYSGHLNVKDHRIKDCVLIEKICGSVYVGWHTVGTENPVNWRKASGLLWKQCIPSILERTRESFPEIHHRIDVDSY